MNTDITDAKDFIHKIKNDENYKQEYKELESLVDDFKRKFTREYIENMEIDDYVLGKGSRDSFCYWLERKLRPIGSILGSSARKFGIYWSEKKNEYITAKTKFGSNPTNAFASVKKELLRLYDLSAKHSYSAIKDNELPYSIRHKIYYIFNPLLSIPIFSKEHINFLIDYFDINIPIYANEIIKRDALLNNKKNHYLYKKMTNLQFMQFVYAALNIKRELDEYDYIKNQKSNINDVKIVNLSELRSKPVNSANVKISTGDYDSANKRKTAVGLKGEEFVYHYEKSKKRKFRKKIEWVSKTKGNGLGYDILSFDDFGNELHIEVKTKASGSLDNIYFFLTSNELDKLKTLPNYVIYYVCGLYEKKKTILVIDKSIIREDVLIPYIYRINAVGTIKD